MVGKTRPYRNRGLMFRCQKIELLGINAICSILVGPRAMGDALIEVLQGWYIYLVGAGFTNNIRHTHTIS